MGGVAKVSGALVAIKDESQGGRTFAGMARFVEIEHPVGNYPFITIVIGKEDEALQAAKKALRQYWQKKSKEKKMSETAFRSKPVHYKGVMFDGHNSPEIAQWIRDRGGAAKAGGSYVNVQIDSETGDSGRARKNDWIIDFGDGVFGVYGDDIIDELFVRVKKRA